MKKENKFFITTPIYYTNGIPHIGHAYSSIIADVIARYNKINGKKVKFSTGVDENSQKAVQKADEQGMEIMPYLDMMAEKYKQVWDGLGIKYTDFIRTTEQRHHEFVKKVLQISYDNGDIYEGVYEGKYCIGCEAFKKDDELIPHPNPLLRGEEEKVVLVCPDHLTEPEKIKEKNWFFRLSKYQKFIEDLYNNNPDFVEPNYRFNEVKAFAQRGLEDFSISRETNKFGITLPFDETQVTYVWYDALFNYLTVCEYPNNGGNDSEFWPVDLHVVGKEISRFHSIFWPAMLKSAGYELPKKILVTGFLTVNGQKISKSLGNVIDPVEFINKYSKDLLTLYLLSSFNIGQDGDFDEKQAILTYNAKLANNLGNLVNRVVVLALKLPHPNPLLKGEGIEGITPSPLRRGLGGGYNLKEILDSSFKFLDSLNNFAEQNKPRILIKEDEEGTREVLYTLAEGLRQVGLSLYPFFPEKIGEMFTKLGLENYSEELENGKLEELRNKQEIFKIKEKGEVLFKRFDN